MQIDESSPGTARRSRAGRIGRPVGVLVLTVVLMMLIPLFVARIYSIPSGSMETTLHGCPGCDNDRVLVDRMVYRFRDPTPGEVVVFTAGPDVWSNSEVQNPGSENPIVRGMQSLGSLVGLPTPNGTDFVKRVVAVGGETVSCCDSRNRVLVNGRPIDESYLYLSPLAGTAHQLPFPPVQVPPGSIFVMGDNRNESLDSRAPGNGPVPLSGLAGKVRLILFPFSRTGWVDGSSPRSADH